MMVEYSLRLDRVLAAATEAWELSEITLADELAAIARTGTLLKEKAEFISADRRVAVQPMIEGIEAIVLNYRGLLRADPNLLEPPVTDATPMPLVEGG